MATPARWSRATIGALGALLVLTAVPTALARAAPVVNVVSPAAAPTAPKNLKASKITQTSVDLAWSASTSSVGIAGYDIYHDGQFIKSVGAKVLKTTVSGLMPNTTYGFYVNARDTAGTSRRPARPSP